MNNIAILYHSQARWKEAEPLYVECLRIMRETLGETHRETANTAYNLALLYEQQNRIKDARELHESALATYRQLNLQNDVEISERRLAELSGGSK